MVSTATRVSCISTVTAGTRAAAFSCDSHRGTHSPLDQMRANARGEQFIAFMSALERPVTLVPGCCVLALSVLTPEDRTW